ncbi:hypothetical protein D9611_012669 [Ephemerocybe angulata]|uniref:Lid2 complex component snt2 n=1 Tax=Ephemerocybe angulata TaxID=980116 RepID=A0A8H5BAV5_9AGAR|nr:hypothetical protein D9611_012669 [Tulosesus angulatus]
MSDDVPVYLKNGEQVKVNDHVYCSPSWDTRDGTPYSVARIMEFLPPADAPKGAAGRNFLYTRVRLAWYYRPSDVSDRPVADSRLLLAAIYSEVCDINQLRAKCHVVHRDKISDLSGWKKRPDRFYFNRLFDPYIKREFEVIPARDVRNLPDNIREVLISRYEYVVAEKEVIPDLTDQIRLCDSCSEWCPSPETVQCDRCKRFFHMHCVQPPLLAKPTRGYGWTCAPCSKKHEEEVDSHEVRPVVSAAPKVLKSNAPPARGRGRPRKDKSLADKQESFPVKHFKMWPFRYFGQYTVAEDTLDEEDLIFPRTATRQGPKYQANVPLAPDPYNYPPDIEERGGDSTVEVLGVINSLTDAEVAEVEACKKGLSNDPEVKSSVDWLTELIRRYSDAALAARPFTSVNMKYLSRLEKWKKNETPVFDKPFSHEEIVAFEDAIALHGPELRAVRDEVPNRSMPEIVRFYGHWKSGKLGEENRRLRRHGPPPKPINKQYESAAEREEGIHVGLSDDEGSIVAQPSKSPSCGACRTRETTTWWKAPKGLPTNVLCDQCGSNWRRYADLNVRPLRAEDALPSSKSKAIEKREGTPLTGPSTKRARTSASVQSTPPPAAPSAVTLLKCLACSKTGPLGKVLKCKKCHLRVHAGAVGATVDPAQLDNWTCELCENEETLEASINHDCLLCPRAGPEERRMKPWPPSDTLLRACKPTEGQGWTHVICAVFTPELTFTDAARLRLVEGMSTITRHRWTTKCCLCGEIEGAVIKCNDCPKEFHISCAWKQGHKFGFEIQPVKSSRRDTTIMTTFKGETGSMHAIISCKDHDRTKRDIYDICESNEGGETALQVYCQAYKQAPVSTAHGLLRKARRLDNILNIRTEGSTTSSTPDLIISTDPECCECKSHFSPAFYRADNGELYVESSTPSSSSMSPASDGKDYLYCHRCHFGRLEERANGSKAMGMMVS